MSLPNNEYAEYWRMNAARRKRYTVGLPQPLTYYDHGPGFRPLPMPPTPRTDLRGEGGRPL